ncbi:hypothetical protein GOV12_05365 [Candidatus Pacearchaeota archaeon]|nr:hypothetical protein [Candidatus Pacearchaeota archaeon]
MLHTKITKLMEKENSRLLKLFNDFEKKSRINIKSSIELFNTFKWNLERRIFLEEKIIYTVYSLWQNEEIISDLLKEHKELLYLLNKIEETLNNNHIPVTSIFKDNLIDHLTDESIYLYPQFEEILKQSEKNLLIERMEESITN